MGCESIGEGRIVSDEARQRADDRTGWGGAQNGLHCACRVERFGTNQIQQKFHRRIEPCERDGREKDRTPPWILRVGEAFPQGVESFWRMGGSDGQGSL